MDLTYVKKLLKLVEESKINELELDEKGIRIRISKAPPVVASQVPLPQNPPVPAGPVAGAAALQEPAQKSVSAPPAPEKKFFEVKSPIVGTFYRAPAPDAAPYVEIGGTVSPGTVLCIVEAMKLMNEIESDVAGKIAKILVENGQPVEFNQVLFLIEPA